MKTLNEQYQTYTAEYCKATELPMLNKSTYNEFAHIWLSKTRCKEIRQPVLDDENPIAFYRVKHGYIPLYDRSIKL